jgi:hypothetical protein
MATKLEIYNMALIGIGLTPITQTELTAAEIKQVMTLDAIYSFCRDEVLSEYGWRFAKKTTPLQLVNGFKVGEDEITITGATQANPVVITATNTYSDEETIKIDGITGMTELNGNIYEVDNASASGFELKGVDGTGFAAYVSGGEAIRYEAIAEYQDGYTYVMPDDCIKPRKLENSTHDFEIREGVILTIAEDAILEYTKRVTNESLFPTTFSLVLSARLAAGVALTMVGQKADVIKYTWDIYTATLAKQTAIEAQKQTRRWHKYRDEWETSRDESE